MFFFLQGHHDKTQSQLHSEQQNLFQKAVIFKSLHMPFVGDLPTCEANTNVEANT